MIFDLSEVLRDVKSFKNIFCFVRSCAEPKAKNILDDLSTLVEYYSVSNDSMDRRMMISEAVPGDIYIFFFLSFFYTYL